MYSSDVGGLCSCNICESSSHLLPLVIKVDPELAMAEADKVEDDEDLRKKLWLMVAKHVVEQEKGTKRENIRKAIAFLKETDGLLKIEDILPFFPDFALIDDFKVRSFGNGRFYSILRGCLNVRFQSDYGDFKNHNHSYNKINP